MSETIPKVGTLVNTSDGKTIFMDPKTGHAFVFDKVTIGHIKEPITESNFVSAAHALQAFIDTLGSMSSVAEPSAELQTPGTAVDNAEPANIVLNNGLTLGEKYYFILVQKGILPLSVGASKICGWMSEFKNGVHLHEDGATAKHMISKGQWDWMEGHKLCTMIAWYDKTCPVYPTVACQEHGLAIMPVFSHETSTPISEDINLDTVSTVLMHEHVLEEEREI